jgi:hypothetical protein
MDWSQGSRKVYPNTVGRWFNGYWDEAFYHDDTFRRGMLEGQFANKGWMKSSRTR